MGKENMPGVSDSGAVFSRAYIEDIEREIKFLRGANRALEDEIQKVKEKNQKISREQKKYNDLIRSHKSLIDALKSEGIL